MGNHDAHLMFVNASTEWEWKGEDSADGRKEGVHGADDRRSASLEKDRKWDDKGGVLSVRIEGRTMPAGRNSARQSRASVRRSRDNSCATSFGRGR